MDEYTESHEIRTALIRREGMYNVLITHNRDIIESILMSMAEGTNAVRSNAATRVSECA